MHMLALGLMSGTSLDGIDAALVETDGERVRATGAALTVPYDDDLRRDLRSVLGGTGPVAEVERRLTLAHAQAVDRLLDQAGIDAGRVGVIGFHGHTILHRPEQRRTWQIGDGALLARLTAIRVVNDFRSDDVAAGGQGAPLVPVYHAALAQGLSAPLAVLNLGGVGNVTWIGADGTLLAFDTGPGNALIDDWALTHTGRPVDAGGALAAAGIVDGAAVDRFARHDYFSAIPPKSLDRDDFQAVAAQLVAGKGTADGAATLTAFTIRAVAAAAQHFPAPVSRWLVCGGGRHNPVLMRMLAAQLAAPVAPVEAVGWDGDALEAQAFAFLAVRSLRGLPLTFPGTTGVPHPLTGGRVTVF
ncbi:MAG: anhydro-N-acetylmuramic acid [Rhodospirillaceae bacterium]|nr:MAG: anhydro-N-acetylmuramic acid [Rhodospirillaceae bacterium]TNC96259.1 MAG: anhydro-N-acetylmuramic acid kinase [Stygiobacter sp.]